MIPATGPNVNVASSLAGASFLLTAYAIYKNKRSTKSLITGLIIATIVMTSIIPETMITLRLFAISAKLNIIPYKGNRTK
jgi:LPXTG-motif cell wall-anchored protein